MKFLILRSVVDVLQSSKVELVIMVELWVVLFFVFGWVGDRKLILQRYKSRCNSIVELAKKAKKNKVETESGDLD